MKNEITISYTVCSEDELDASSQLLLQKAGETLENAFAPYSNFKVGAAFLLDNGKVVLGSNYENASFSLTNCAERIACQYARTNFPESKLIALAIVAHGDSNTYGEVFSPCGACRQVLAEVEQQQGKMLKILMKQPSGEIIVFNSATDLLPLGFGRK